MNAPAAALTVSRPSAARPWIRDFALVGGISGFAAPAVFFHGNELEFAALTGLGGAVAGALLGALSAWWMSGRMRRWSRLWLFPLGGVLGFFWGAASGGASALLPGMGNMAGIAMAVAAIAGALQLGWFWFAYCVRRVNHRSTWQVVLVASLLSCGLGYASAAVFLRGF